MVAEVAEPLEGHCSDYGEDDWCNPGEDGCQGNSGHICCSTEGKLFFELLLKKVPEAPHLLHVDDNPLCL